MPLFDLSTFSTSTSTSSLSLFSFPAILPTNQKSDAEIHRRREQKIPALPARGTHRGRPQGPPRDLLLRRQRRRLCGDGRRGSGHGRAFWAKLVFPFLAGQDHPRARASSGVAAVLSSLEDTRRGPDCSRSRSSRSDLSSSSSVFVFSADPSGRRRQSRVLRELWRRPRGGGDGGRRRRRGRFPSGQGGQERRDARRGREQRE
jgi:hypothetical protein